MISKTRSIVMAAIITALLASASYAGGRHLELQGTWVNDLVTVRFDWRSGTISGVNMGEPFKKRLVLVEEYANVVIFMSGDNRLVAQFQKDGSVMITNDGGIPLVYRRAEK